MEREKRIRKAHRGQATKLLKQLETAIESKNALDASLTLGNLKRKAAYLESIDKTILEHLDNENLEDFVIESDDYINELQKRILESEFAINEIYLQQEVSHRVQDTPPNPFSVRPNSTRQQTFFSADSTVNNSLNGNEQSHKRINLPKINIPKFSDELLEFPTFWDMFESSIHNCSSLSTIDKFTYLKCYLIGEAKLSIDGLSLTNDNYSKAIDLIKNRFGQSHKIVQAYINFLIELDRPQNNLSSLRKFFDGIETSIRSLESLGKSPESYKTILVPMLWDKIPSDIQKNLARAHGNREWELDELRKGLQEEIEILELCMPTQSDSSATNFFKTESLKCSTPSSSGSVTTLHATAQSSRHVSKKFHTRECIFCKGDHYPSDCTKLKSRDEKLEFVNRLKLCFNCLGRHKIKQCQSVKRCLQCKQKHHTSLCNNVIESKMTEPKQYSERPVPPKHKTASSNKVDPSRQQTSNSSNEFQTSIVSTVSARTANVLLKTAVAPVFDGKLAVSTTGHFLFDDGSQRSFITENLVHELKLTPFKSETIQISTFESNSPKVRELDLVNLNVLCTDKTIITISALVVPKITQPIQHLNSRPISSEFQTLQLAHPMNYSSDNFEVTILIGSDNYYKFIEGEILKSDTGPIAVNSKFGFLICGPSNISQPTTTTMLNVLCQPDVSDIDKFWSLESFGILPTETNVKQNFLDNYCSNSITFVDGRYQAKLPWLETHDDLPSNVEIAYNRTRSSVRRLAQNPDMLQKYQTIIQNQLEQGFIEKVEKPERLTDTKVHYLPHHAVLKDSTTTPVRIVFDCSCHQHNLSSLNSCLESGPSLQNDIPAILMRFRLFSYGVITDIEKAFLQISLDPTDRDVTRFFWLSDSCDPDSSFEIYRFKRLLFGAKCSPFILNSTVLHHLNTVEQTHVAENMKQNIYVDNIVTSFDQPREVLEFYDESREIMSSAKFNLRCWSSNCSDLQSSAKRDKVLEKDTIVNVLGIHWDVSIDKLQFNQKLVLSDENSVITKRHILQRVSRIYDPLGLISPVSIRARILIQDLWKNSYDWDSELPDEFCIRWKELSSDLHQALQIDIPRQYRCMEANRNCDIELHVFGDASLHAYGAVCYVKKKSDSELSFVVSKSRVAPIKTLTIPQLELMAATTATRLGVQVRDTLQPSLPTSEIKLCFWSDSNIVLSWLCSQKKLTVFVTNRVKEIRKLTDSTEWHYCNTSANPADLITRGLTCTELFENKLWFHGPEALVQNTYETPLSSIDCFTMFSTSTKVTEKDIMSSSLGVHKVISIEHFSTLEKLLRVTAWVLKFISILKSKQRQQCALSMSEIKHAQLLWTQSAQRTHFSDVFESLSSHSKHNIEIIHQLQLFLDNDNVIRSRGRLHNAALDDSTKFPTLLPKEHYYTKLVVLDTHRKVKHSGVNSTVTAVRLAYWVPRLRQLVKSLLRACVICHRLTSCPYRLPNPPPLPESRVSDVPPFYYTGVDFCGPLYVKTDNGTEKNYVCLFTCAVTRAVHLELTSDLSVESFLGAFRRFSSRRSLPRKLISDNASTFISANSVFKDLFKANEASDKLLQQGVEWQFITKRAPWQGGFYERLIGTTKLALKKILYRSLVTHDELQTILAEIEAIINNRPLTYISEDISDCEALTPSQLISGYITTLPHPPVFDNELNDPEFSLNHDNLVRRARVRASLINNFRKRWSHDYLVSLREYHRFRGDNRETVKLGSVVQIEEDNPRIKWRLGVITDLHRGRDGHIRSVTLKTSTGVTNRPISRLYPLEVYSDICSEPSPPTDNVDNTVVSNNASCDNDTNSSPLLPVRQRRRAAVDALHKFHIWLGGEDDE